MLEACPHLALGKRTQKGHFLRTGGRNAMLDIQLVDALVALRARSSPTIRWFDTKCWCDENLAVRPREVSTRLLITLECYRHFAGIDGIGGTRQFSMLRKMAQGFAHCLLLVPKGEPDSYLFADMVLGQRTPIVIE